MRLSKPRKIEILVAGGLIIGLSFVLFYSFERARKIARGASCQSNLKQIGLATIQYVRNYDEKFPLENNWRDALIPYTNSSLPFHCPSRGKNGYAFNAYISRLSHDLVQGPSNGWSTTPMFFESSLNRANATDFGASWPQKETHPQGIGVVYADGRAEWRKTPPYFRSFPRPKPKVKPKSKTRPPKGKAGKIN